MATEHWGVLGGGVLGLTLALALAEQGKRVTLIEAADSPGGLVTPWRIGETEWDRFYHVIVSSDQRLLATLHKLGIADKVSWGRTKTLFFAGESLHPLNNVFDYLRLPTLRLIDKLRLGFNIVYGSRISNPRKLEGMSAAQWLTRISGRRAYENLWRPLLRAKLGSNEPQASAAFIWSIMRRFYGAREGGAKVESYGYVEGGYRTVVSAFRRHLENLGVDIVCDAPVKSVDRLSDGGVVVQLAEGQQTFDKAVMTFAAPIASRVCDQFNAQERARLQAIQYQGVVCVSLLLKRPLGGAYLTYITDESLPFTTVIEMTSLVDRQQLGGHHLVYLPKYVPCADAFLQEADESVIGQFVAGLKKMYPDLNDEDIVTARVARTPYVAPVMTKHYSKLLPPAKTSVRDLFMISSAQLLYGSSSVEETMRLVDAHLPQLLGEQENV